jgi:hypothetical protein
MFLEIKLQLKLNIGKVNFREMLGLTSSKFST